MELDVSFNLDSVALISGVPSTSVCQALSLWGPIAFDPTFGSFYLIRTRFTLCEPIFFSENV
jgi:hypothetical protein